MSLALQQGWKGEHLRNIFQARIKPLLRLAKLTVQEAGPTSSIIASLATIGQYSTTLISYDQKGNTDMLDIREHKLYTGEKLARIIFRSLLT